MRWLSPPIVWLALLSLVANIGWGIAFVFEIPIGAAFSTLYSTGVAWALAWWVLDDCHKRRIPVSIDHGWLVFWLWPVVVPYHVIRTRGARGLLFVLGLFAMFGVTWLVFLATWFLRTA